MRPRLRLKNRGLRLRSGMRSAGRGLLSPWVELLAALVVALFGAWLIALWAVGLVFIVFAALLVGDALLRDSGRAEKPEAQSRHEEILEQWRKAR